MTQNLSSWETKCQLYLAAVCLIHVVCCYMFPWFLLWSVNCSSNALITASFVVVVVDIFFIVPLIRLICCYKILTVSLVPTVCSWLFVCYVVPLTRRDCSKTVPLIPVSCSSDSFCLLLIIPPIPFFLLSIIPTDSFCTPPTLY